MTSTTSKLSKLRSLLQSHKVDGYLIDSGDAHASEYIATIDERRAYLSGFRGSAGTCIVDQNQARLFTDGRYHLQAQKELSSEWTLMKVGEEGVPTWQDYLKKLPQFKLGFDPNLISIADYNTLSTTTTLVPIPSNLIDEIWPDQPARSSNPVSIHPVKYAGKSAQDKLQQVRTEMEKLGAQALVVSLLDEVAWLLNLRGTDIIFNPVFFAHLFLPLHDAPTLFINADQLDASVREYVIGLGIRIEPYDAVVPFLKELAKGFQASDRFIVPARTNFALADALGLDRLIVNRGIIVDLKCIKNDVELQGFRNANVRDGIALVKYFAWLEDQLHRGENAVSEKSGADKLLEFRSQLELFKGLSFGTISSTGANGSIIHYSPPEHNSAIIDINEIYLCDSGAQFADSTTDTTRTHHFGTPRPEEKAAYTRVLQGHIAIDTAVFPSTTTGYILDPLARQYLWKVGLDYRHGTSHGVGSFLNVHEGPAGLGVRVEFNNVALKPGMVLSNEPGYYEDGKFGIRIENVVICKEVETTHTFGGKKYLGFERVTVCPIATNLVDVTLLSNDQIDWVNAYHVDVYNKLKDLVKDDVLAAGWLKRSCAAIGR